MALVFPSWFKQRQGKAEEAGPDTYRLTAPNQEEAWIKIRNNDAGLWSAAVLRSASGPELEATGFDCDNTLDAWYAAFELYRRHVTVGVSTATT